MLSSNMTPTKYKVGVHPLSHALEWKDGGVNGKTPAPPSAPPTTNVHIAYSSNMTPIKLSHTTHGTPKPLRGGYNEVIYIGKVSSSQDGIIVSPHGIAPVHTAGHGNCPKILIEYNI